MYTGARRAAAATTAVFMNQLGAAFANCVMNGIALIHYALVYIYIHLVAELFN